MVFFAAVVAASSAVQAAPTYSQLTRLNMMTCNQFRGTASLLVESKRLKQSKALLLADAQKMDVLFRSAYVKTINRVYDLNLDEQTASDLGYGYCMEDLARRELGLPLAP